VHPSFALPHPSSVHLLALHQLVHAHHIMLVIALLLPLE
jgi:hypothetical protein